MGLQLIFAVETNKKCKSDWIYIKDTIDRFYQMNQQIKLTTVYMDGKTKYKAKEKEIAGLISQYASTSKGNRSRVIYCFDCDDYDLKQEDADFLKTVQQYCSERDYEFVWFCKDIERVYLGKKVHDSQKGREAVTFREKQLIAKVEAKDLSAPGYRADTSNIMKVLDKYLTRK